MKQNSEEKGYSLRFLVIRAAVVIAVVVAALLVFRMTGVTVQEQDVPAPVVEEITREGTPSAQSMVEAP